MADKRISQLVERVTLLNNDVFPIVASGAATTNKVTLQTIDDYMQTNLNFGVTSVAMTVPTGLSVTGTPITSTGTFIITFTAGYSIPTTAKQTQWDTAYNNRIVSVTAPITFASNVLGITQSGVASDGYLSSTDWNTFNSKQNALTFGNLTEATSSVLTITGGTGAVIGSGTTIQVTQANGSQDGFLDSADWTTFNGKQNALTGTGIVKSTGGTITYLTDNTSNWDSAYNDKINSAAVTGTTTKTLTLTQQDGGTITTTWTDLDTGTVTSVGVSMPSAFSVANSPITSSGTIAITGAGLISQYIDGTGALQTFPSGLPPTGAAGGDLQGTYPNPTVHRVHGIDLQSGTPTADDVWVYGGSPAKWQHQKLHSNQVTEDGNLFYTDARARASISESVTGLDYNSTTGVLSTSAGYGIPTTASQTTWDAAYNDKINSAAVTGTTTKTLTLNQQDGGTITASWTDDNTDAVTSVFGRTGAVIATEGDYSLTQLSDVTITTPSNGQFLKYDGASWINAAAGTVTSVALATGTTGTDIGVTGSPITGAGTITLNIPVASATNTGKLSNTDWILFNSKQNAISLTTTGTSGAATLVGNILNIPNYSTDLSPYVKGSGTATRVAFWSANDTITSSSGFYWDNVNGRLAVGKNDANARLEVYAGTKGQIRANGGTAMGGGIDIYTELSGTGRRNWGIQTEVQIAGDFSILKSASAGAAPTEEVFTIQNTGIGSYKYALGVVGDLYTTAKLGASDNNGLFLRGVSDATHKLYYSTTRVGIILEINNTFSIDYYNNGSPSTAFTFGTTGNFDAQGRGTFNTGLNILGHGGMYNAANKFGLDQYNSISRFYSNGPNTTTAGQYEFHVNSSNGSIDTIGLYIGNTGNIGVRIAASTASDTYLKTGDAGIAYGNTYFGTGQVRIGGGSDHTTNVVLSVAPGVVCFDRPGVAGGAFKIDASGNGIFGIALGVRTTPSQPLTVNQNTANAYNQGIPATSGTTQNGILRLQPSVSIFGETLDFGMNVGPTYAWLQPTNTSDLAVNYNLVLNPNGGNIGLGTKDIPNDHIVQICNRLHNYARFALTNTTTGNASGDGLIFQMENNLAIIKNQEAERLCFGTSGRETDIIIAANGVIGIGVIPSGTWTTRAAIQIGSYGTSLSAYQGGGGATELGHNIVVTNGFNYNYSITAGATKQYMDGANIIWARAPIGTAGTAITFSQLANLNDTGLAIGGSGNPNLRLSVFNAGAVITSGTVTFASQAKGIEIYNDASGTTDNLVGCWFSTGPHKAGIASGRTNAAANWAVDLRFFVHGPEIAQLDQTYEKMRLGGDGTLVVVGDVVAYGSPSDIRLKTIKEKVPNALESVLKLNGYKFDWKETNHLKNYKEDIGVIAQEVEALFPELARKNDDGYMSVRYQGLTAVLIEAVKEQQKQIDELKKQVV